ncbi:MAG: putative toxin-antitoxin system toxin component, PIN family [Ruminococcus sp.]|nr:putative toxin-antitoxin system toxin component, PIN family [Ruminococcus sp.]
MKYAAVVDTNILVSALLSSNRSAATVQVFSKIADEVIIPMYSYSIMEEYRDVLARKKFNFSADKVDHVIRTIKKYGRMVIPDPTEVILPDIKDMPFYEVVMCKRSINAYLITGNIKHFPDEEYIVTARRMMDIIEAGEKFQRSGK